MPDSNIISEALLEKDGVFQNLTIAVGVTVKQLQGDKTRLAITDGVSESVIMLDEAERQHLIGLLNGVCASG